MFAVGACGNGDSRVGLDTRHIDLDEQNESGYNGEAIVVSGGDNRSVITLIFGEDGESPSGDFPAAIYRGSCDGLAGGEVHDLGSLERGLLSVQVNASLEDLTDEDHSIVVFQSDDRRTFVACGGL